MAYSVVRRVIHSSAHDLDNMGCHPLPRRTAKGRVATNISSAPPNIEHYTKAR